MPLSAQHIFYERHLPHYQPPNGTYTVMFRLAGSLPAEAIDRLRRERLEYTRYVSGLSDGGRRRELLAEHAIQLYAKFESLLDGETKGPQWLGNSKVARIVEDALHHWDCQAYELLAYCIMPNHVHSIFSIGSSSSIALSGYPLKGQTPYRVTNIVASIKKYSALRANRELHRSGHFWQDETFDHVLRNPAELEKTIWYILYNPVSAGLVGNWEDWPFRYVQSGLIGVGGD